jgi:hypothetical protein
MADATIQMDVSPMTGGHPGDSDHFEAMLASRTKVPVERIAEYSAWSPERFQEELTFLNDVLKRFARAVVDAMEAPASADAFIRELDLKEISQDHSWRAIFSTIRAQDAWNEDHKRTVLVKYLQYLGFRKRLVEFISARQGNLEETRAWSGIAAARALVEHEGERFVRLPMGEAVDLNLPADAPMSLLLAGYRFRLARGEALDLMDDQGRHQPLPRTRNLIGRHPSADVVVDAAYGRVSRAHLLLERRDADQVTLLDISSGGTFVPPEHLSAKDRMLADAFG